MGFSSGAKHGRKTLGEINVTPFVDVVLVLLVIFMVTAPMLQTGIQVNLPKATLDPIPADTKPVVLSIDSQGTVYLGDSRFAADEIATALVPLLQKARGKTIYLRADEALPYGRVAALIALLHENEIRKVSLVTEAD